MCLSKPAVPNESKSAFFAFLQRNPCLLEQQLFHLQGFFGKKDIYIPDISKEKKAGGGGVSGFARQRKLIGRYVSGEADFQDLIASGTE